jgi:hypothetical protein
MSDTQTQPPEPAIVLPQQTKRSRSATIGIVAGIVLAAVAAMGVYHWQHQKVESLSKKNSSLASQLKSAQKVSEPAQTSAAATSSTIAYKASVGKFTLTLPNKYVIIVGNDGGYEGGPMTSLTIGESTSTPGVVSSSNFAPVTVRAAPLHGTFRSAVDSDPDFGDGSTVHDKSAPLVDGVKAEAYMVGGFGDSKIVFFTKGDILYKLTFKTGASTSSSPTLDAVIAGFKFN